MGSLLKTNEVRLELLSRIRNRQVSGSSPLVGSILSMTCDQFTETCTTAGRAILISSCFIALVTTSGTVLR